MNPTIIIQQLQDNLSKKYDELKVELPEEELKEMFGPAFNPNSYFDSGDDEIDNPAAVDVPYTTHAPIPVPKATKRGNILPFESKLTEAEDDKMSTEDEAEMAADEGEEAVADITGGEDAGAEGGDMPEGDMGEMGAGDMPADMGGDMGGDMGDTGMDMGTGMEEEEKSPSEIGRIYELKKIYTRLTSIESYLSNESDQTLLEIRNYVSQGIELFELVSSNFKSYKEKLDEIIITYYKFLLEVYKLTKDAYNKQAKAGDK